MRVIEGLTPIGTIDLLGILSNPAERIKELPMGTMPKYDGPEPSELEIARIIKLMDEDRFEDVPEEHQRWLRKRLIPSLVRYGCYPPPQPIGV